jgi:hypothetical protein
MISKKAKILGDTTLVTESDVIAPKILDLFDREAQWSRAKAAHLQLQRDWKVV